MANTTWSSKIVLRVTQDEKELIERAAALTESSMTAFVRYTLLAAAREMVRTHEVVGLTAEEAAVFVEAVTNLLEPNEHLRALARKYRTTTANQEQDLRVVIEEAGGNYSAYSPDLPGCVATGDTREEVEANMREAIAFHTAGLCQERLPEDWEVRQAIEEAEAQIERGEGLSFEEAFGEEQ